MKLERSSAIITLHNGFIFQMADSLGDKKDEVGAGIEGPNAMFVKLIASDGHEFIIKRDHALTSGTIKALLSGPGIYFSSTHTYRHDNTCNKLS